MVAIKLSKRRRAAYVAAALLLFVLAWFLINRLRSPSRAIRVRSSAAAATADNSTPRTRLRIGAFNIAHGRGLATTNWGGPRPGRLQQIADLLARHQLDIVVLNEVDFDATWSGRENQAALIAHRAGFPFWAEQRSYDLSLPLLSIRIGNALLSKYPIERAELIEFPAASWIESTLVGKKNGLLCTVSIPGFGPLRLLAVHLESRAEELRIPAVPIIEALQRRNELPLIAAGDFNSTPLSYPFAATDKHGRNAMTQLLSRGAFRTTLKAMPTAGDFTFSSDNPSKVIDWILVPVNWQFSEYRVLDSRLSDHRPVVATVELPTSGA